MPSRPIVSVVLPTHNAEPFVAAAIQSLVSQTLRDFELLAIDDGSTDDTLRVVRQFAAADARVQVIACERRGLVATLNTGIEHAAGRYIARMDADDIALPRRFEMQVATLEAEPAVGLLGAAITVMGSDGQDRYVVRFPRHDQDIRRALTNGSAFAHPVVMMRKQVLERSGGYRAAYQDAEDYDLWLRMAEQTALANLPIPLLKYRVHAEQVSLTRSEQQVVSIVAAQVAAKARATSRAEPFQLDRPVTLDTLQQALSDDPGAVRERIVRAATMLALQMLLQGNPRQAEDLLTWALTTTPWGDLTRSTRSRLRLARASIAWHRCDYPAALTHGLSAGFTDPLNTAKLGWGAVRARVSR